jgi:glycosyltransferase involved in cell wall biosynthesis
MNQGDDEAAVIIPTLNSAKYLVESIESIINQTWTNIKIYILDGGSSDSTLDIINSYSKRYKNITLQCAPNVHPCKRVDQCIKEISSPYFALQHSDDISYAGRIEAQLKAFKSDQELGAVSVSYRSFWHERTLVPTQLGEKVHAKPIKHSAIRCQLIFWWVMHGPTMMFDRKKAVTAELRFENECLYANDYWQTISNIDKLKYENIDRELSAYRLHFSGDGHKHSHQIAREETLCKQQALRHFGFEFSEKELEIHCRIKFLPDGKLLCNTIKECDEVIAWLERLLEQNKKQKTFDEKEFDKIVKGLIMWTIEQRSFTESKQMNAVLSRFLKV